MKRFKGTLTSRMLVIIISCFLTLPGRAVVAGIGPEENVKVPSAGDAKESVDNGDKTSGVSVEESVRSQTDNVSDSPQSDVKEEEGISKEILIGLGIAGTAGLAAILIGGNDSADTPAGGDAVQPSPAPDNDPKDIVGPNISGSNWSGYFKNGRGAYEAISATITQNHDDIALITTKSSGLGRSFHGKIRSNGHMLLYDDYDHEDWTTLFGPATKNSVNLADYVFVDGHKIDTNKIVLKR